MLARCPNCRATFSTEKSGQQTCPACQKPLIVPEQPVLAASLPPVNDASGASDRGNGTEPIGTPWERRPELPLVQAWWQTMTLALFEPDTLFARARLDKRREQTVFAVLTFTVFQIVGNLIEALLLRPQEERWTATVKDLLGERIPPFILKMIEQNQHFSIGQMFFGFLFAPVVAFIFLYLNAAVTHACASVIGQNRRGFDATFAACAYAMAPVILLAIPGCGSLIAALWVIVLTGVGMKRMHGLTPGGATATALVPYLIFCCGLCLLLLVAGSVMTQVLTGGGALPQ